MNFDPCHFDHVDLADELKVHFSHQLCEAIDELNISKKKLANLIGISEHKVNEIIKGNDNITINLMAKIAFVIGHDLKIEIAR